MDVRYCPRALMVRYPWSVTMGGKFRSWAYSDVYPVPVKSKLLQTTPSCRSISSDENVRSLSAVFTQIGLSLKNKKIN